MPQNYWFTSDTHLGHARVIEYSKRPFANVNEMNEAIVQRWNAVVAPGDFVYHLGDFAFLRHLEATQLAKRLNGQKYLIFGNHDKALRKNQDFLTQWIWAKDYAEITIGLQKIVLSHYPFLVWNKSHYGSWNLHGHCHGSLPDDPRSRRVDVGVDVWNYTPVNFDEIQKVMNQKVFKPIDYHGARGE